MAHCCSEHSESRQRKAQNMSFKALALNAHYAGEKTAASEGSNTLRDELKHSKKVNRAVRRLRSEMQKRKADSDVTAATKLWQRANFDTKKVRGRKF